MDVVASGIPYSFRHSHAPRKHGSTCLSDGTDSFSVDYRYQASGGLHVGTTQGGSQSWLPFTTTGRSYTVRSYETTRDSLAYVRNVVDSADVSRYAYGVNALGQRTSVTPSGSEVDVEIFRIEGIDITCYVYDGWNRIAECSVAYDTGQGRLSRRYLWGPDLSGSMQGAGGVGGLLSMLVRTGEGESQTDSPYCPTYDGNANISEYLDAGGDAEAHFEYDPFGNLTVDAQSNAAFFPYRFSTKPQDPVTGLLYYGYRDYDAVSGRWASRDPGAERGGVNLYGFVANDAVRMVDLVGLLQPPCLEIINGARGYEIEPPLPREIDTLTDEWPFAWDWVLGRRDGTFNYVPDCAHGGPAIGPRMNPISMSYFDPEGCHRAEVAREWMRDNLEALRTECAKLKPGDRGSLPGQMFRATVRTYCSQNPWISGYQMQATIEGNVTVSRRIDGGCPCEIDAVFSFEASDKSDFNPGDRFEIGFFTIPDDFAIFVRDHTPFGRDFWITSHIKEPRSKQVIDGTHLDPIPKD